jgi:hypothetical protein
MAGGRDLVKAAREPRCRSGGATDLQHSAFFAVDWPASPVTSRVIRGMLQLLLIRGEVYFKALVLQYKSTRVG